MSRVPDTEKEIQRLQSYYSLLTPSDIVGKYATSTYGTADSEGDDRIVRAIMNSIFNNSFHGIYSLEDIEALMQRELQGASDDLVKRFHKLLTIGADGLKLKGDESKRGTLAKLFGLPDTETDIKNPDFKIGYIMSNTPRISLNVRDTSSVSVFMNAIPTIEFSRAIPYLSITFRTGRKALEEGKYLKAPTVLRFLKGSDIVKDGTPDSTMIRGTSRPELFSRGFDDIGSMGMEIFTSPVSMTPFSTESDPALRSNRINDPLRPIMSIDSLTVEVVPTVGTFQYKTANLSLILHDKSRLSEVSDLVRPEGFGAALPDAGIEITYGWSHPDDALSGNVYGALLNRMRVTEVYSIVNSKFSFDTVGQVRITLSLATKGAYDTQRIKILDGDIKNDMVELEKLKERIKTLREQAGLRANETVKEIRVFQVLDAAEAAERPDLKEFGKKLDEAIKTLRNLSSTGKGGKTTNIREYGEKLAASLEELYKKKSSDDQPGGLLGKIDRTVFATISARFNYLANTEDPFLIPLDKRQDGPVYPWDEDIKNFNTDAPSSPGKPRKNFLVSLGALLMTFCGPPMIATKNVNEVQFVFHTVNDFAGKAAGQNLALLPVDLEYFKDIFQKLAKQRRSPNYTLEEFVRIVSEHIINNPRSVAYGMRSLYQVSNDKESDTSLPKIELARNVNGEKVANQMAKIMENKGGSFKFPILEVFVETMPRRVLKSGDMANQMTVEAENIPSYNIMRIHIYDKNASPYENVFDMLHAAKGDQLDQKIDEQKPNLSKQPDDGKLQTQTIMRAFATYVSALRDAKTREEREKVKIPDELKENDGKHPFKKNGNIVIPGAVDALREFLRETIPSITYGSNLTAVTKADLTTLQDAQQQAILMMRAGRANPTQPNGSDVGGIPVQVLPTICNLTTMGCPLLSLFQQFFVDFGTGTTADNIYTVTGLTHEIKQGHFETKVKMTPAEAYGKYRPISSALEQAAQLLKLDK